MPYLVIDMFTIRAIYLQISPVWRPIVEFDAEYFCHWYHFSTITLWWKKRSVNNVLKTKNEYEAETQVMNIDCYGILKNIIYVYLLCLETPIEL